MKFRTTRTKHRASRLDEPLPEQPTDAHPVVALLDEVGSPATMASAGGRFFGFVVGGALAANWLAGAWDQNAGVVVLSPIAAKLEDVAMRWLLDLFGLPRGCGAEDHFQEFTCGSCQHEFLVAFSCKCRYFCPSCHAKRLALWGLWNQRGPGLFKGLQCFQEALALDPAYALAHAGVADAYSLLGFYGAVRPNEAMPRAKDAAHRALALDDGLAEAHSSLGWVSMVFDWDWETAEAELRRAIAINPKLVAARYWYAAYLAFIRGAFDEAVAEARRAVELDPLAVHPRLQLGLMLYVFRRFADAVAELEVALQSEPSSFLVHRQLALALFELGRTDEAVAALQRAIDLSNRNPWAVAELCGVYGQLGRTEEAIALYQELESRSSTEYVQPVQLAAAAGSIGRRDAAFAWLERALDEHDVLLCVLRYWPPVERVGWFEDPRFAKVLERVGLV